MERNFKYCRFSSYSRSGICNFDCLKKQINCECREYGTSYKAEQTEIFGLHYLKQHHDDTAVDRAIIECTSYATTANQISEITCTSMKPDNILLGDKITDSCIVKFFDG
ncbi:hypothetical protein M153_27400001611, partial [Pseudoloma neurophilia]